MFVILSKTIGEQQFMSVGAPLLCGRFSYLLYYRLYPQYQRIPYGWFFGFFWTISIKIIDILKIAHLFGENAFKSKRKKTFV